MEYLHTMVRVKDIDASLKFYCDGLGLSTLRRVDNEQGRFTLVFLATPKDVARANVTGAEKPMPAGLPMIELTYNWPDEDGKSEDYGEGRNFGHVAYRVENIYETCARLQEMGITINRPPRDGYMAFIRSPDNISVELLQTGERLAPCEPWASMENTGKW